MSGAAGAEEAVGALWLSREGSQISARAIDLVVRRFAKDADIELSAHVLRLL
jgi:site-specific recombinase XerD